MASALNTTIKVTATAVLTDTVGLTTPTVNMNYVATKAITNTQAPLLYSANDLVVGKSGSAGSVDIAGGTSKDPLGNTISMATVSAVIIENFATNVLDIVTVSGLNAAISSGTVNVPAGGVFCWTAPAGVAQTADITLTLAAGGASTTVLCDVVVVGKA